MRKEKRVSYYYGSEIMFRDDILKLTAVKFIKTSKSITSKAASNKRYIRQLWRTMNEILFEFIWVDPSDFMQEVVCEIRLKPI